MILIFILELAAGIAGYALRDSTTDYLTSRLTESMENYDTTEIATIWDLVQKEVIP